MKKILLVLLSVILLVFIADRIYQYYSRNFVNSHESIVLINNVLNDTDVDAFFKLKKGTYNPNKHKVVFSLEREDGYQLEHYINLPVKKITGVLNAKMFDCSMKYQSLRSYGFYDYELGNRNIIARVLTKESNPVKLLNANKTISKKYLRVNFKFGRINVFDVGVNMVVNHCN